MGISLSQLDKHEEEGGDRRASVTGKHFGF